MRFRKDFGFIIIYKLILIIISSGFFYSNLIGYHIISLLILVLGSMILVKFDILHPYTWFGGIYLLYSLSYPILYLLNSIHAQIGYSKEIMILQWLAYAVFFIFVSSSRIQKYETQKMYNIHPINRYIIVIAILIILVTISYLASLGNIKKTDIEETFIVFIGFRMGLILLVIYSIELINYINLKSKKIFYLIIVVFLTMFLLFLYSGERDFLYRFFIITFITIFAFSSKKNRLKMYISIPFVGLLLPLINKIKFLGLRGEISSDKENIIESILMSDFHAASRNLQTLINYKDSWDFFYGYTFLMDILNAFKLSFLNHDNFATIRWYNERFFAEERAGQGFTIVGEGYINFGYLGVIVLFIFLSLIINLLYKNSNKNIYNFIIYVYSIPIFMYATRADLANIISPMLNYILITIIILWIINNFSKEIFMKNKNNSKS